MIPWLRILKLDCDFHSHATDICITENPFSIEVSDASEKFQLELIQLKYDSILHSSCNQEVLITLYISSVLWAT